MRKRKKLLVLVNPVGGRGRAVQLWQQVPNIALWQHGKMATGCNSEEFYTSNISHLGYIPCVKRWRIYWIYWFLICNMCKKVADILVEVGIECEVVVTTHAGHARFSLFSSQFICSSFLCSLLLFLFYSSKNDSLWPRELVSSCEISNYGGVVTVSGL